MTLDRSLDVFNDPLGELSDIPNWTTSRFALLGNRMSGLPGAFGRPPAASMSDWVRGST
jgi:hypothetical protein